MNGGALGTTPLGSLELAGGPSQQAPPVVAIAQLDVLLQLDIGSTDWAGGTAPAGGSHTGVCTITMVDGLTFVVAHDRAEVQRKRDRHAIADINPRWVAFDVPNRAVPVILDARRIRSVA